MTGKEQQRQNRNVVGELGDLVENLFSEVAPLPISDAAKTGMVTVMMANCLKNQGHTVTVRLPNFTIISRPGQAPNSSN